MPRKTSGSKKSEKPTETKPVKKLSKAEIANMETIKPLELLPKHKRKSLGGVIYIGHLPKGFEEPQLRQFFEQFGAVVRVSVARSLKTQRSKGYGYVHFAFYEVAEIAAAAVNNYMLFQRVLRTDVLPKNMTTIPSKVGRVFNSKGEQTKSHKAWAKRHADKTNAYVGNQVLLSHRLKQLRRINRSKQVLEAAGVEVPELDSITTTLQQDADELKQKLPTSEQETTAEPVPEKKKEDTDSGNDDDDDEEPDDDEDFASLKASDWDQQESASLENNNTSKASAIKKAQLRAKELHAEKQATNQKAQQKSKPKNSDENIMPEPAKPETAPAKSKTARAKPQTAPTKPKTVSAKAKATATISSLTEKNRPDMVPVATLVQKTKRVTTDTDRAVNVKPAKTRRTVKRS